jgi:hypothetical protein
MKKSVLLPLGVGGGLLLLVVLAGTTSLFQPVVQFIHTGEITYLQALYCLFAAVLAIGLVFKLLVLLGHYFLPENEKTSS